MNRATEAQIWDFYNGLLLSKDIERVRKLLVRYEMFKLSLDVPGDILECGVFKGVGMMYWLKLLAVFAPGSRKKVIGFDTFCGYNADGLLPYERDRAQGFVAEASPQGTSVQDVWQRIVDAGFAEHAELIPGDLVTSAPEYAARNKGFRISLLHLDADTYAPTKAALEAFYPLVSRGGVILLDEYACRGWGETDAVDEFFASKQVSIRTVPYGSQPTAYIIKP